MPSFRNAGLEDVAAVVQLVESAYRGESSRAGWTTEAHLLDGQRTDPEEVASLTRERLARLLLAQQAGELVGCVLVRADREPQAGARVIAQIGMFAVRPALQARGLGRALLAEAERVARTELGAAGADLHAARRSDFGSKGAWGMALPCTARSYRSTMNCALTSQVSIESA
jgi:ribosomal protein S18 acetylase RimI-like enzyme